MVPVTGLEPVRHRWRRILSPLRLPFHHTGRCVVIQFMHCRMRFASASVRLRCPKFLARISSRNFDRCPLLGSLLPPQAALPSLPRLEPVRHRWRRILSPLRLLFSHTGRCVVIQFMHCRMRFASASVRLRCPKFLARISSRNFDRCPLLGSLLPPQAALPSLPRLEPVRHRRLRILSPLRLLFSHTGRCFYSIVHFVRNCKRKFYAPNGGGGLFFGGGFGKIGVMNRKEAGL